MEIALLLSGLLAAAVGWDRFLWPTVRDTDLRADWWAKWWSFGCAVTLIVSILLLVYVH